MSLVPVDELVIDVLVDNQRIIGPTVEDLAASSVELLLPGHCTGWRALAALSAAFAADQVTPLAVGMRISVAPH